MDALLEVNNLNIQFRRNNQSISAVKDISFQILKSSITAIVGESGSGKSLTSLAMLQLLPKEAIISGSINFTGEKEKCNLLELTPDEIIKWRGKRISMIFQEPMTALNPLMTCGEQVAEMFETHLHVSFSTAAKKTLRLFEEVELPDPETIFNSYPHQISGGQKQRVMIAMAIACQPDLLIADEPTTALDVRVQYSIMKLLVKLQSQYGLSILLITHDLGLVKDFADNIIVMQKGVLVESGKASEVLNNPVNAYTKGLLACRPQPKYKGKRLPVMSDFLSDSLDLTSIKKRVFDKTEIQQPSKENFPAVEVKNLTIEYPLQFNWLGKPTAFHKALNNVSFQVNHGETLGIVGESGCGKTTLGKTMLGLIKPTYGHILIDGKEKFNGKQATQKKREMQIVFQDPYGSLNPVLTIGEAIEEPMRVRGMHLDSKGRKKMTSKWLDRVGLDSAAAGKYPHQFSGGQRQRICIARALALEPNIMVFDESVSALDVSIQAQILNLINDLKQELGFTSLFITHDLSVVRYISDRILVMQSGKIVESGETEEIFQHPKQTYTRELLSCLPGAGL